MAYLDSIAQKRIGILGLGVSGVACVSFLMKFRIKPFVMDGNAQSKGMKAVKSGWPEIETCEQLPQKVDLLIVSPGIAQDSPWLVEARERDIEVIGDIELFARINRKPVIAITGSNGKSTVTKLVTEILQNAGIHAVMGGNIGVPVLSLLAAPYDVAVLELSSFQLETTDSLQTQVSTILNIVEDHMDRYESFEQYAQAKQRIYQHCDTAIYNRDDALTIPDGHNGNVMTFGLDTPVDGHLGLKDDSFVKGEQIICPVASLNVVGAHNVLNALAALALVDCYNIANEVIEQSFQQFEGLPHRCQVLKQTGDVRWINDSKATNVGATIAALEGIGPACKGKLILIAGGLGKEQDFSPLAEAFKQHVSHLITIGEDGQTIAGLFEHSRQVESLEAAVESAAKLAQSGDCVLLSPACASQDMFRNFEVRGEAFCALVTQQIKKVSHVH